METNQYPTIRSRLAIVLIILAASFGALLSSIFYLNFRSELRASLKHRLENITTLAGLQQNGDDLIRVQAGGDEYFENIHSQNVKIKRADSELRFVYTMRKDDQGIYFVVDARLTPDEPLISEYGDRYEEPSPTLVENFDSMTGTIIEADFYTDEFGTFLSGYTPILTTSGEQVGVLGVDISANTILAQERAYLLRLIFIYIVALILLIISGVIFANYLAKPIIGLRDVANKIIKGDFNFRITDIPRTRELAELALDFNAMTANLSDLINDLERRVEDRTTVFTRKSEQLRAASYIARQTAEAQDLAAIIDIVVNLVTDQFGYYHAGIFLINENGDEAILQAASSEGGRQMIARGYSLSLRSQGTISYVVAQKKPRIALDVGSESVLFNNPDLPMTRSEVALPLLIRGKVLGVLDIQSDEPMAFRVEDVDVLQTLADQVAVAIENARLLGESQAALIQLEAVSAVRTREAWTQKLQEQTRAFTYTPLGMRVSGPSTEEDETRLRAPITLRGQKIGVLSISRKENSNWSRLDEDLIGEVAYQVGLAVDNLRLLEDAQQRAKQEQTIGELATRFSQSLDVDSLLQAAARELGQIPDVAEVSVFIGQLPEQVIQKPRSKRMTGANK
jgi:GAF domain-containing protein/HAMP domain-containing protein